MTRIFVGGLAFESTESELAQAFRPWGRVDSSSLRLDRDSGRSKGFGVVEMSDPFEAGLAIHQLNGTLLGGRRITVAEQRIPTEYPDVSALLARLQAADRVQLPDRELLEAAATVRVSRDLISQIGTDPIALWSITPRVFEELVCELLDRTGFECVHLTPESKDKGVDIYALQNGPNGALLYVVECKRWVPPHHVGIAVVQRLYGVMHYAGAAGGLVVTTSYFTRPAEDWREAVKDELALRDLDGVRTWIRACAVMAGAERECGF